MANQKKKKILSKLSICLALVVNTVGCATGKLYTELLPVPENKSVIYLMRNHAYGAFFSSHVYLNNELSAKLRAKSYAARVVNPGEYTVAFTEPGGKKQFATTIQALPNQSHFVIYRAHMLPLVVMPGFAAATASQTVVEANQEDALQVLRNLRTSKEPEKPPPNE